MVKQEEKLLVLNKELESIQNGQDILNSRKEVIELEIKNSKNKSVEEVRAIVMMLNAQPKMQGVAEQIENPDKLLKIQADDFEEEKPIIRCNCGNLMEEGDTECLLCEKLRFEADLENFNESGGE